MLTTLAINNAKPKEKEYKLYDEKGLYIAITPKGSKIFRFKYKSPKTGNEQTMRIGEFGKNLMSLAEAREERDKQRKLLESYLDPIEQREKAKLDRQLTVEVATDQWWQSEQKNKLTASTISARKIQIAIICKYIGSLSLKELTNLQVKEFVKNLKDSTQAYNAKNCLFVLEQVLSYHHVEPFILYGIKAKKVKATPYKAIIDDKEFRHFINKLYNYTNPHISINTLYALKLIPHLYTRINDLLSAQWCDIDLDKAQWTLLIQKSQEQLVLPLSTQVVAMLRDLKQINNNKYVFESVTSKSGYSDKSCVNKALKQISTDTTLHGFRASALTIAQEVLKQPFHVIDLNLGHRVEGRNGKSYNRVTLLDERRELQQAWSNYIESSLATN